ncbi:thiosulfate/3-mercaptopyruvate sulfurtransferase [Williamsia limnetica]|uniref:Thiosulfate/3-mercaptopyruvate sulfurtransferase n=1 Tax=Williamsia limnetica TaxID=882452 RepID=A0A318RLR6_WILLI|nr:sulfurtransferase [Williamsia limnetica]PYE17989.1 thiosulfate/3-mercaptopyruvate sulfurtransferase [Williamsia limnetica]
MSNKSLPALVDVAWLQSHLDDADVVVVDATTHLPIPKDGPYVPESGRATYEAEHIPGALFAELLTDFADPDAEQAWTVPNSERFADAAGALGIGPGAKVVVYDQSAGFWATRLWWHLRLEGFDEVAVLDGGIAAWKAADLPVTDTPSTATPREFIAARRPELLRSTEQIRAALDDDSTILVNVLDEPTYRGETTTYARNGHIPGSINVPVAGVLNAEKGGFKSVAELRETFEAAGLLDTEKTIVTYCGGGIAATGVAQALSLVGRDDVAVYDGSMTAWAADPELPLVTGESPRPS